MFFLANSCHLEKKFKKKNCQILFFFKNDQPFTWEMFVLPQRNPCPRANVLSLEIMASPPMQCSMGSSPRNKPSLVQMYCGSMNFPQGNALLAICLKEIMAFPVNKCLATGNIGKCKWKKNILIHEMVGGLLVPCGFLPLGSWILFKILQFSLSIKLCEMLNYFGRLNNRWKTMEECGIMDEI